MVWTEDRRAKFEATSKELERQLAVERVGRSMAEAECEREYKRNLRMREAFLPASRRTGFRLTGEKCAVDHLIRQENVESTILR